MEKVQLGRTGLMVTRTAFGALPIQRADFEQAKNILRRTFECGINFFDTARNYSDSEEKIGLALADRRNEIVIATKSSATTADKLFSDLETSLANLRTDYVDILQLHNPSSFPDPNDKKGAYAGMVKAREKGMVRFIGISSHRLALSRQVVASGLYDTLQYPFCHLASEGELSLAEQCKQENIGFIAMKALSGGLINNAAAAFAFLRQYQNVVPIWGIQTLNELEQFIELEKNPPALDRELQQQIDQDRKELSGAFCRACGYCMPCPVEIPISMAARMSLLLKRAPWQNFVTPEWQEKMARIENCTECGQCRSHCPYELDTPALLKKELRFYRAFLEHKGIEPVGSLAKS